MPNNAKMVSHYPGFGLRREKQPGAARADREPPAGGPHLRIALVDGADSSEALLHDTLTVWPKRWKLDGYPRPSHTSRNACDPVFTPHVALAALGSPSHLGPALIDQLKLLWPRARVIALLEPVHAQLAWPALLAGADGCLVKPLARHDVVRMIELATRGLPAFCPDSLAAVIAEARRAHAAISPPGAGAKSPAAGTPPCKLDEREKKILACLEEGLLYKEINDRLGLSYALLRKLQRRIYAKLDADTRVEAVQHWHNLTRQLYQALRQLCQGGGTLLATPRISVFPLHGCRLMRCDAVVNGRAVGSR